MMKPHRSIFFWLVLFALGTWSFQAGAYPDYAAGCLGCHGDFRANPYVRLGVDQGWGDDLHDVHRNTMLSGDCSTCHSPGGRSPVFLDSSSGGIGLAAISCVGCHGREEDIGNDSISLGRGAGLRQHHYNAGFTSCVGCHSDSNPANYTPVGENVAPPYYSGNDTNHPNMPSDPCNTGGAEDYAGDSAGVDNDGDLQYDALDVDCAGPTPTPATPTPATPTPGTPTPATPTPATPTPATPTPATPTPATPTPATPTPATPTPATPTPATPTPATPTPATPTPATPTPATPTPATPTPATPTPATPTPATPTPATPTPATPTPATPTPATPTPATPTPATPTPATPTPATPTPATPTPATPTPATPTPATPTPATPTPATPTPATPTPATPTPATPTPATPTPATPTPATPTPATPTPATPTPATPTPPTPTPGTPTPATPTPPTATPEPPCTDLWPVMSISTIAKGQSPTNNMKVSHEITGNIIDPDSLDSTVHRIPVCAGTFVSAEVSDSTGTPMNSADGNFVCDSAGCSGTVNTTEKYKSISSDGKDTDRITLLPQ